MQLTIISHQGSPYTDKDRRTAVAHWLLLGSVAAMSRATGVPERTLRHWMETAWWEELVAEVGREMGDEISAQVGRISTGALDAIEDRLHHGDVVVGRSGVHRVPMRAHDLLMIFKVALEQRERLRASASTPHPPARDMSQLGRLLQLVGEVGGVDRLIALVNLARTHSGPMHWAQDRP